MESTICEQEKIQQQLPLVALEAQSVVNPNPRQKSKQRRKTWKTPEFRSDYLKKWRREHRERCREYARRDYRKRYQEYRNKRGTEEFKSKLREYVRARRKAHPELHKASLRRYYQSHRDQFKEYRKQYAARRRELYQLTKKDRFLVYRLKAMLRYAFHRRQMKKPNRTEVMIGCKVEELRKHIEAQFVNGMGWDKPQSFVIDHFVPISAFDLRDNEELLCAFNWKNLRPITWIENAHKHDTIPNPLPSWLPAHIADRIKSRRPAHPVVAPS